MRYEKRPRIRMKKHQTLTETWLKDRIVEDSSLLGFGDVLVRERERSTAGGGKLDLLLVDSDSDIRYEVEVQLGATDASHIIRTIEYWDLERRHHPHVNHVAVIVAEEITSRFFNVISLFNGHIPIVAMQVSAIDLGNDIVTLLFTKVLDHYTISKDDEEEATEVDRSVWEASSNPDVLGAMDQLFEMVQEIDTQAKLNYTQSYVGLSSTDGPTTYIAFKPKKVHLNVEVRLAKTEYYDELLENSDLMRDSYNARSGKYRLGVAVPVSSESNSLLEILFSQAYEYENG